MLDNRQCRTVTTETREMSEVRPILTLAFIPEAAMDHGKRRKIKDGNRHVTDVRRKILECREDEVAGICDAEQYKGATQRKSSRNLLRAFRSLGLEVT